jgi:hypothetical protein
MRAKRKTSERSRPKAALSSRTSWRRFVRELSERMSARIALAGLDPANGAPDSPASMVLCDPAGVRLRPRLAVSKAQCDAFVALTGNPWIADECLEDALFVYAMDAADAGFLLGVIAGTALRLPVVEALEPAIARRAGGRSGTVEGV